MSIKIIALPLLAMIASAPAYATNPILSKLDVIPGLNGGVPAAQDYTFSDYGLNLNLSQNPNSGYTLTLSNSIPNSYISFDLLQNANISAYGNYSLTANFNSNGAFENGNAQIIGQLVAGSILPAGASLPTSTTLYAASLTSFGVNDNFYGDNQYTLGFGTQFLPSWATQNIFTGGSAGEVIYLFPSALNTPFSVLKDLADAFSTPGGLATLSSGSAYTLSQNVNAITSVPLPMPAVLFGTGISALIGFGRRNRNPGKIL